MKFGVPEKKIKSIAFLKKDKSCLPFKIKPEYEEMFKAITNITIQEVAEDIKTSTAEMKVISKTGHVKRKCITKFI